MSLFSPALCAGRVALISSDTMSEAQQFARLVGSGNFTATISVLDQALEAAQLEHAAVQAKLVQLFVNRGLCHQRLGLNRKALKVRDDHQFWRWRRGHDDPSMAGDPPVVRCIERLRARLMRPSAACIDHILEKSLA